MVVVEEEEVWQPFPPFLRETAIEGLQRPVGEGAHVVALLPARIAHRLDVDAGLAEGGGEVRAGEAHDLDHAPDARFAAAGEEGREGCVVVAADKAQAVGRAEGAQREADEIRAATSISVTIIMTHLQQKTIILTLNRYSC